MGVQTTASKIYLIISLKPKAHFHSAQFYEVLYEITFIIVS